jgi:hypothetical protein
MARKCPCGKSILPNRRICKECGEIYGFDSSEWPEWLRMLVNDITREEMDDSRHDHLQLDEIEPNGRGGYRSKREFALRGCRTETHLYQERDQHGGK